MICETLTQNGLTHSNSHVIHVRSERVTWGGGALQWMSRIEAKTLFCPCLYCTTTELQNSRQIFAYAMHCWSPCSDSEASSNASVSCNYHYCHLLPLLSISLPRRYRDAYRLAACLPQGKWFRELRELNCRIQNAEVFFSYMTLLARSNSSFPDLISVTNKVTHLLSTLFLV
jgi:hypothetical protein